MGQTAKPPHDELEYCPRFHAAIELIGRRWTGAILLALFSDLHRFGEIRDAVPGLSDRLLTERLKELEAAGIVARCSEQREISYALTEHGLSLRAVIDAVFEWVEHSSEVSPAP